MEPEKDVLEQLELAELWFACTSGDRGPLGATIPVVRDHGLWLFKAAADEIKRLREFQKKMLERIEVCEQAVGDIGGKAERDYSQEPEYHRQFDD